MNIRKHLDAFMAKLGYARAPGKSELVVASLKIEVDDSQVKPALKLLEQMRVASEAAEVAASRAGLAATIATKAFMQAEMLKPLAENGAHLTRPAEELTAARFEAAAPNLVAAAEQRFAANPFASTFEVLPGEDAIHIKLFPRAGSVQYLVNVTGPRSASIKFEAALPKFVQVERLVECEPGS
ncbi:hypothetical protein GTP44_03990 [Duganella sp. FT50W]|uniref:Uncharacterized protein n=1 Tax=Duganella lactea TaxID=2692173 RepID=A0A6L8MFF7_9BURK|nr:hypothetical protein [Duganella lactea]MYM81119.1 hypothetical protein [Duganella lactea]